MKPLLKFYRPALTRRGFTMLEILAVMAVIGILLAVCLPAVIPMMRASNVNRAATMIMDEMNQARQLALTRNRDVEIRFYQISKKSGGAKQYRAFRTFITNGLEIKPLGKVKYLPEPAIISDNSTFSTLLDYANVSRSGLVHAQETLSAGAGSVDYISFMFRANGGTNLAPVTGTGSNWFLTLYLEDADKNSATQLPANYYNIQVDPITGRIRSYRP